MTAVEPASRPPRTGSCSRPRSSTRTSTCAPRAARTRRRSPREPKPQRRAGTARSSRCRTPSPSSTPPPCSRRCVERAREEAVVPTGFTAAISKGQRGEELTEMAELAAAGAIAFTDDGRPVASAGLMRRALAYSAVADRPLALHCEEPTLSRGGQMHEGAVSAELGLRRLAVRRRDRDGRARPRACARTRSAPCTSSTCRPGRRWTRSAGRGARACA